MIGEKGGGTADCAARGGCGWSTEGSGKGREAMAVGFPSPPLESSRGPPEAFVRGDSWWLLRGHKVGNPFLREKQGRPREVHKGSSHSELRPSEMLFNLGSREDQYVCILSWSRDSSSTELALK